MNRTTTPARFALVALLTLPPGVSADARGGAAPSLSTPILFTQLPAGADATLEPPRGGGLLRTAYGEGCRIVRLDPDGTLTVLTEGFASACEPDVSFDGERFLFAGKRNPGERWTIFEMGVDGSDARRVTRNAGNCRHPAYQATLYTIVSTEPWFQVMFESDVAGALNEIGSGVATSLYSCRLDGSELRRLTMNLSDDFDPYLMNDGRVLGSAWQRLDTRRGLEGRVSLFTLNPDGADYSLYCENGAAPIRHMACETRRNEVVFVEANTATWDGAGWLASVSRRRPFHSYRRVTEVGAGLYHSPTPIDDGTILVARRPYDGSGTHGLYQLDPRYDAVKPIYDDPAYHDFHARQVVARERPDGRSTVVQEKYETGKLYCMNATRVSPELGEELPPGTVKAVRLVEGVPLAKGREDAYLQAGAVGYVAAGSTVHGSAPIVGRRILGTAPIESDGSFQLEVPPDTPILLQTLDADGLAIQSCGWIWAKHREWRGCIGCHEDPELVPENRFVEAVRKDAIALFPPVEARRTVTFARDVRPIVERRCVSCHDGKQRIPPDLTAAPRGKFDRAYLALVGTEKLPEQGKVAPGDYVHPGRARTSPLVWWILGKNTARPWDEATPEVSPLATHPPDGAEEMTAEERATIVEWIDLGAAWDDGYAAPAEKNENSNDGGSER